VGVAVVEDGYGRQQGLGVEIRVFNQSRGAGPDHLLGVTALMPGCVGVRHHNHRQPKGRNLGQRGRTRSTNH
jgi:hypothetical protein